MIIAIILILCGVALFLIFHDDHDKSYTRSDRKPDRSAGPKSEYQKSETPRRTAPQPSPFMGTRPAAPKPQAAPTVKASRPVKLDERFKPDPVKPLVAQAPANAPRKDARYQGFAYEAEEQPLDFHFLDRIDYDPDLPERTMSSFIAGLQGRCTPNDLGGLVGYVLVNPDTEAMEVHASDDRLMGYLPLRDKAEYHRFNPEWVTCPFAGHVALSVTGTFYADIRIVLPSSRDFVEESLVGFLG